jgi:Fic family protein
MAEFAHWLANAEPGPETAFDAHYRLVTIHPFSDGNGRTARLLMNLILFRAGYPPLVIAPEQRVAYLDALQQRQTTGDDGDWTKLMLDRLEAGLDAYLDHIGGRAPS